MQRVIIDTDILSEYLKEHDPNVVKNGDLYAEGHTRFTFTSVTVYEIAFGLEAKSATKQLEKTLEWLQNNEEILPVEADYLTAAWVKGAARRQGYTVEMPDCLDWGSRHPAKSAPRHGQYRRFSGDAESGSETHAPRLAQAVTTP